MLLLILFIFLFPLPVLALDIGHMTAVLEPSDKMLSRTIKNDGTTPKIYEVQANRISNPTANGKFQPMPPGELLYSPKRFVLHAKQQQNVKFYYKGVSDAQERYYRVTFVETPAALAGSDKNGHHKGTMDIKIELQSILVVRPRQSRFEYQLDPAKGSITNTGNTYFEFMVKQGCQQADSEADSKYLLPGETYHNSRIGQPGNQKLIVYQSRFIQVGKECWPD